MVRSHAGDHKNECCDPAATTQTPKRFAARMVIMPAHALPTNEPRRLYNLDNPVRCKRYKLLQQIIWASPRLHSFTTGNQLEGHGTILLLSVSHKLHSVDDTGRRLADARSVSLDVRSSVPTWNRECSVVSGLLIGVSARFGMPMSVPAHATVVYDLRVQLRAREPPRSSSHDR